MTDYAFFQDGVTAFARNLRDLHSLAGEGCSAETLRGLVLTLPRARSDLASIVWQGTTWHRIFETAQSRVKGTENHARFKEIADYFLRYIPSRNLDALDMLEAAFLGILGNIEPMVAADGGTPAMGPPPVEESIHFTCPNCGRPYRTDPCTAGRKAMCKECGSAITIPDDGPS